MGSYRWCARSSVLSISLVVACCTCLANGQATPQEEHATNASGDSSQALHAIDQLVDQNRRLEQQNRELMDQIDSLRRTLSTEAGKVTETVQEKDQQRPPQPPPIPGKPMKRAQPAPLLRRKNPISGVGIRPTMVIRLLTLTAVT